MIATWMLYAALVAVVLGAAAWMLERATRDYRIPSRWIWTAALAASGLFPLVALIAPGARDVLPAPVTAPGAEPYPSLEPLAAYGASSPIGPTVIDGDRRPGVPQLPTALDPFAVGGWLLLSLTLVIGLVQALRALIHARRGWPTKHVDGRDVFVSEAVGPALVGVLRPTIVMPRWALELSPRDRELVLRHEEQHKRAGDARLLFAALLFLVLLPWNVPLWWQLRRLRLAVELDCDQRVLRISPEMRRYATLLLEIGRRRTCPLMGVALAEPASFLERRIHMMTTRRQPRTVRTAGLMLAAGLLVGAVWHVEQPLPVTGVISSSASPVNPSTAAAGANHPRAAEPAAALAEPASPVSSGAYSAQARMDARQAPGIQTADAQTPHGVTTEVVREPRVPEAWVLDPAQIRGRVTDLASAEPLADARVYLPGVTIGTTTSRSGEYVIVGVPAGTHEMRVDRLGYASASRMVTVTDGAVFESDFALTAAEAPSVVLQPTGRVSSANATQFGRIRGQVSSAAGPLRNVRVSVVGANLGAITREPDGAFLLIDVPAGDYTIQAQLAGWITSTQQITVREGDDQVVHFTLGPDLQSPVFQAIGRANERQAPPLIFIDGVRQPAPSAGSPGSLDNLEPDSIERIEVIKGAAAVRLYGEDAVNGVIQIFLKKPPLQG